MITLYCKTHHRSENAPCEQCKSLIVYSNARLDKCVFGKKKPVCAKCPVHCYKPEKRNKIREVMYFAGPRMIYRYPYLAVMHVLDKHREIAIK